MANFDVYKHPTPNLYMAIPPYLLPLPSFLPSYHHLAPNILGATPLFFSSAIKSIL